MVEGFRHLTRPRHCEPQNDPRGCKTVLCPCVVHRFKGYGYVVIHFLFGFSWLGFVARPRFTSVVFFSRTHCHDLTMARSPLSFARPWFTSVVRSPCPPSFRTPLCCTTVLYFSPLARVHLLLTRSFTCTSIIAPLFQRLFATLSYESPSPPHLFPHTSIVYCGRVCPLHSLPSFLACFVCVHPRLLSLESHRNIPSAGDRSLSLSLCFVHVCGSLWLCLLPPFFQLFPPSSRCHTLLQQEFIPSDLVHIPPRPSLHSVSRRSPTASVPLVPLHGRLYASPSHDDSSRRFLHARVAHPLAFFCARPWFTVVVSAFLSGLVFPPNIS